MKTERASAILPLTTNWPPVIGQIKMCTKPETGWKVKDTNSTESAPLFACASVGFESKSTDREDGQSLEDPHCFTRVPFFP